MALDPRLLIICLLAAGTVCLGAPAPAFAEDGDGVTEQPSVAELEARARDRELEDRDYPHHDHARAVDGEVECPEIELIEYAGEVIAYNRPIEINPRFKERLVRFEKMVAELATTVYGRPPARLIHAGGYTCKTIGGRGEKLSEHVFGHAIDVIGFEFEAASDEGEGKQARIATAFSVRVEDHWDATEGFDAKHSLFLRILADELKERGPFSTMLGPAYKGHDKMFHFDFGPEFFFRI